MAVNLTLTDLSSLQNESTAIAKINANTAAIQAAFQDVLSLDGQTPNSMNTALDMNSNEILNLPAPVSGSSPMRLTDFQTLSGGGDIIVSNTFGLEYVMNGGGAQLGTGLQGTLQVPFGCLITQVSMASDQTGSVVVDIWKCPYSTYNPPTHPAVGDSITHTTPPTITSGVKYNDSALTNWITTINAQDILAFNINSVSNITRLTVCLTVTKT